ncbi:GntR family transcriptional regulator [Streptomyces sp. NBC_01803]|uniref:GntR family transcriptional regulator n=1 Tax=Streptomyces sp. NBC_01803 TaxID=2975946 RepID=UPI002DDA1551|nr:GntR family transcriptional regulator [Streptomyces sp. NBC_01803]WSA43753.1 GntR family transcriptional regulator [Streptomyces sp. NBC_01803]
MEPTRTETAGPVPSASGPAAVRPAPPAGRRPRPLPARHSVRDQVLAALREDLARGELAPGRTYSAPALAERYGVSATPVREAMQRLASEGAVEIVPNRGFRVAGRSARDTAELAEVRSALEVPAVLRLARALPPERWDELRPLADATVGAASAGDRAAYAAADRAFHRALMRLTGNRQLVAITEDLHRRAQVPAAHGALPETAELLADALEHTALLDALRVGDYAGAEALALRHLAPPREPTLDPDAGKSPSGG